jgi:uncharacterized cupredoxin-like copper-binding protein
MALRYAAGPPDGKEAEMNQRETDTPKRRREGDRRFFVRLFGFLAGLLILGLIAIAYAIGFGNGKDEGRKVQPAAAQVSPTETQAAQPASTTPTSASGGNALQVTMSDDFFTPQDATAKAGSVKISTPNTGQLVHEMVMAKTEVDPSKLPTTSDGSVDEAKLESAGQSAGEIADVNPGDTKEGTFKLAPGNYVMFCNVPGHYAAGMYGTITVK